MSVKSHLTYEASVRPENAVTYSAGNERQKICGVFSETAPLHVQPCISVCIYTAAITPRVCTLVLFIIIVIVFFTHSFSIKTSVWCVSEFLLVSYMYIIIHGPSSCCYYQIIGVHVMQGIIRV